jgi:hypothetical protein
LPETGGLFPVCRNFYRIFRKSPGGLAIFWQGVLMNHDFLYPLVPQPLPVDTGLVRGKLFIEGSLEYNYVTFRFRFTDPKEAAPPAVSVRAANRTYLYYCTIRDGKSPEVRTPVFHPAFSIGRQFTVSGVVPLAAFGGKT